MKRQVRGVALGGLVLVLLIAVVGAQTQTITLSGTVSSAVGPLAGAVVSGVDPISGSTVGSDVTVGDGTYTLFLPPGTYDIHVTPPAGSGLGPAVAPGRAIYGNTNLDFVLIEAGGARLSGRVFDGAGQAVGGQYIALSAPTLPSSETRSAADGSYALSVQAGTYTVSVSGFSWTAQEGAALPQNYAFTTRTPVVPLTTNVTLDLVLPFKRVTVQVQDPGGNPLPGVALSLNVPTNCSLEIAEFTMCGYSSYTWFGVVTDEHGEAVLWLVPTDRSDPSDRYVITAMPPGGGTSATTTFTDIEVTTETTLPLRLKEAIVLSGRVFDGAGQAVGGQYIALSAPTLPSSETRSAADASYALSVQAGTYTVSVSGFSWTAQEGAALPQNYAFTTRTPVLSLTTNMTLDLVLPFKRLTVQVQDPGGNPLPGVALSLNVPTNCSLEIAGFTMCGYSSYTWFGVVTDEHGEAVLWLVPTDRSDPSDRYVITAMPPSDSPHATFTISNIEFTSAKSIVIVLPWVHEAPVTTSNLAPAPAPGGTYSSPVTVTLSAIAFGGATVAHTYYAADGGTTRTYSGPFQVTGEGMHTVRYWSVDSSGVIELPRTTTFEIAATIESLLATTQAACAMGGITKVGICQSLQVKLNAAKAAHDRGQSATAVKNLQAYLEELEAQRGKAVLEETYQRLFAQTLVVIANLR